MNIELWSGFFGSVIGAVVGGIIAYLIVRLQINLLEKQQTIQETKDKVEKEIQLLWQIYFDIKKDSENSKLWDKYEELIQKRETVWGTASAEYISETLQFIMRDIWNFFILLDGKENDIKGQKYNELNLLWERAGQLLIFMLKIYEKLKFYNKLDDHRTFSFYTEANELFQKHIKVVQKK
ncbi:MAG: hypothetical protein WC384_07880 [Prolixibacteraceae bacterium]|jgi:gas vesicle protein